MDNIKVNAVWPVIVEDFVVGGILERGLTRGLDGWPVQSFVLNEVEDGSKCLLEVVDILYVSFQVGRRTLKQVDAVDSYCCLEIACVDKMASVGTPTDGFLDLAPSPPPEVFFSRTYDALSLWRNYDGTLWTIID